MDWATKEGLFAAKVPVEEMEVPDIGRIKVRGLTVGEKDEYEGDIFRLEGRRNFKMKNARAQLLLRCVLDKNGTRFFADKDMGKLLELPAVIADPIIDVARRLSGMATGDIEEMVKNSETARGQIQEGSATD